MNSVATIDKTPDRIDSREEPTERRFLIAPGFTLELGPQDELLTVVVRLHLPDGSMLRGHMCLIDKGQTLTVLK